MRDDRIFIEVPYCDEEGTIRLALHNLFCGNGECHSIGFELKENSYRCKKCGSLKSYRLRPEEEQAVLEQSFYKESYDTRH